MLKPTGFARYSTILEIGMKGWIMDGIAREAAHSISLNNSILYLPTRRMHLFNPNRLRDMRQLKHYDSILFMHYRPYFRYFEELQGKNLRVFITHVDSDKSFGPREIWALNQAQKVIFQNRFMLECAVSLGLSLEKCLVGHGGVSEKEFFPSKSRNVPNFILISGECKPRKNPELIHEVILYNPKLHFKIHGRGWENFFKNRKPDNLELLTFDKSRHPKLMRSASLLLSLALNEGGPFPILEALASGTPVVCSRTGFATEVVSKDSGFVLSKDPSLEEIADAIWRGIQLKQRVFMRNLLPMGHDWKSFAKTLYLS